jgi:hypothetical protein
MAKPRMDLSAFVGKLLEEQDGDVLREGVRVLAQALMESEVTTLVGAERHERSDERTAYRNGTRVRSWDTRVGTVDLAIPKVRPGTYFPSLLQPRRRAEQALLTVVQEAYVHGVSTRKVDDLVKALGLDGISKSEVSRICAEFDPVAEAFRTRPLSLPRVRASLQCSPILGRNVPLPRFDRSGPSVTLGAAPSSDQVALPSAPGPQSPHPPPPQRWPLPSSTRRLLER